MWRSIINSKKYSGQNDIYSIQSLDLISELIKIDDYANFLNWYRCTDVQNTLKRVNRRNLSGYVWVRGTNSVIFALFGAHILNLKLHVQSVLLPVPISR